MPMRFIPFATRFVLLVALLVPGALPAQPAREGGEGPRGDRPARRARPESPRPGQADKPAADPVYEAPLALVGQFDRDADGRLDTAERAAALAHLAQLPPRETAPRRPGDAPAVAPRALEATKPGEKIAPDQARNFADLPLYDPAAFRTVALEFEDSNWEAQLAAFASTDVLVPARLTLDGRTYSGVGVRFAPLPVGEQAEPGYKRTLLLRLDHVDPRQQIAGQRELRFEAAPRDATFLRTHLYLALAARHGSAPRSNFVQIALNGENWGVYTNVQPFDENFLRANFGTDRGARWTVAAGGGLTYLGDDPAAYRALYRLEGPDSPGAWQALIRLCRTLEQTPPEQLEKALAPLLDVEGTLRFLALENALLNQGGYRAIGGGYGLVLDAAGRFHPVPLAGEQAFRLVEKQTYEAADRPALATGQKEDLAGQAQELPESVRREVAARSQFPKQSPTDLALLLSYSFVNKSDRDDNQLVTRDEWLGFARSWFISLDTTGARQVSRERFIDGFRRVVTPNAVSDGRTRQKFGDADPAVVLGGDFFAELDQDRDAKATRDEFIAAHERWLERWSGSDRQLAREEIETGLKTLFSTTVFSAEQRYIAVSSVARPATVEADGPRGGPGGRGGGGGPGGDSGMSASVGLPVPGLQIGTGGLRRRGDSAGRTLVIEREQLDVLAGIDDPRRPLLSKLLAVPALRRRYLVHLNTLATEALDWDALSPQLKQLHATLLPEVRRETHKPDSFERFARGLEQDLPDTDDEPSLRKTIEDRRAYVLEDETVQSQVVRRTVYPTKK